MHHLTLKPAAETQLTNQTNSTTVSSPVLAIVLWPGRVGKKEVAAAAGVPSWPDTGFKMSLCLDLTVTAQS